MDVKEHMLKQIDFELDITKRKGASALIEEHFTIEEVQFLRNYIAKLEAVLLAAEKVVSLRMDTDATYEDAYNTLFKSQLWNLLITAIAEAKK